MNKKIKFILLVLILILSILIISSTYSKYTAEADAVINRDIAAWIIKVNDTDITVKPKSSDTTNTTNTTGDAIDVGSVTFKITGDDVKWDESSHTAEGKVAPGMKGYFYLRIDPEKTQTALKYTINIDIGNISDEHINFRTNLISEENGKELKIKKDGKNSILQRIKPLDEIKSDDPETRIDKIKVEVEWVDDPTLNDFDTKLGEILDKTFQIPITVNAIQYTGEGYDI